MGVGGGGLSERGREARGNELYKNRKGKKNCIILKVRVVGSIDLNAVVEIVVIQYFFKSAIGFVSGESLKSRK